MGHAAGADIKRTVLVHILAHAGGGILPDSDPVRTAGDAAAAPGQVCVAQPTDGPCARANGSASKLLFRLTDLSSALHRYGVAVDTKESRVCDLGKVMQDPGIDLDARMQFAEQLNSRFLNWIEAVGATRQLEELVQLDLE